MLSQGRVQGRQLAVQCVAISEHKVWAREQSIPLHQVFDAVRKAAGQADDDDHGLPPSGTVVTPSADSQL